MRIRTFLLATAAAGGLALGAHAAEADAKGAEALRGSILSILPEKAAATGFVEVTPERDHYRFAFDFGKLIRAFVPVKELDVSAVYDGLIFPPAADGTFAVRRDSSDMTLAVRWEKGAEKGSLSYLFRDLAFEGQFDPALSYFRSFTGHGSGGSFRSDGGPQKVDGSFGPYDHSLDTKANPDGSIDTAMNGTVNGFREAVADDKGMSATVSGETIAVRASLAAFKAREVMEIARFFTGLAGKDKLEPADKQRLASLVAAAMPVFGAFDETFSVANVAVESQGLRVKIDAFDYKVGMDGLRDGSAFRFGFHLANPDISGIPQMMLYGNLVPKDVSFDVTIPGLNFASPTTAFLEQADFTRPEPLTKEQSEAIGKMFLKDGRLTVEVPNFSARSALYDISATGTVSTDVTAEPAKANATFDVTARNLDGTIKGIQELGQKIPELNTASFALMMAKGLAKSDPDGTAHWKVEVSDDGTVKINGQVMPH